MRALMLLAVAGLGWSQSITDAAGVLAGSSVGVGAGKKVSDGITSALGRVDATAAKAATAATAPVVAKPAPAQKAEQFGGPVIQTSPGGVVKDHSLVPPPPPRKVAVVPPPPPIAAPPPTPAALAPVYVAPPPPPPATPEDLRTLASGVARADVLKLGTPSSRITMFDDGHLVEIYRYQAHDTTYGVVRLSDGSVSSVQVR